MTRIYMDLLRLEPNLNFSSDPAQLFRQEIQGPDGKPVFVFYRNGQRREREETDGEFCLSPDETGIVVRPGRDRRWGRRRRSRSSSSTSTRRS